MHCESVHISGPLTAEVSVHRFKQRGKAAEAADNVFHHVSYEGAVDVESMTNKQHRAALEAQINEFGQCPRYATATLLLSWFHA